MAAFALSDVPPADLDACLNQLADSGFIAILNKEQMSFTPRQPSAKSSQGRGSA
jgi:hypothetical protein